MSSSNSLCARVLRFGVLRVGVLALAFIAVMNQMVGLRSLDLSFKSSGLIENRNLESGLFLESRNASLPHTLTPTGLLELSKQIKDLKEQEEALKVEQLSSSSSEHSRRVSAELIWQQNNINAQELNKSMVVLDQNMLGERENKKEARLMKTDQAEADQAKAEVKRAAGAETHKAKEELENFQTETTERAKTEAAATTTRAAETTTSRREAANASTTEDTQAAFAAQDRKVHFMPFGQVDNGDAFSASWLQRTEDFLTMELDRIGICEDAAFVAFRMERSKMLRMTLDWFDFSLEHLSKWWKLFYIFHYQEVYNTAITRFDNYLANAATFPMEEEQSFRETIAVIAYQPYRYKRHPKMPYNMTDKSLGAARAYNLTVKSLGVTVESLRRAGFGRVVVVGDGSESDNQLTQNTFRYLQQQLKPSTNNVDHTTIIKQVGHMEVAYTKFNPENAVTKTLRKNIPKATLDGLKLAFDLSKTKADNETEKAYIQNWLGDKTDWKYVYLTEPDSVLQFRPSTLKQLKEKVDQGTLLVPHRLQPIPHELDAGGTASNEILAYLPEENFPVLELDSIDGGDSCCDAHLGPQHKPHQEIKGCGSFWYICDFKRKSKAERIHKKIQKYSLFGLKQGTGIVTMTANESGRPCIPKKNDICLPPHNLKPMQ